MQKPVFEELVQLCVVVRDVKKAIDTWENVYGIGPWEIVRLTDENSRDRRLHGRPFDEPSESILAMSRLGNMYLELIEPVTTNTAYWEFLEEHGEGVHHLAIKHTDRFVPLMEARKIEEIASAWLGNRFCAYYDTRADLGFITEIY